MLVLMNLSEKNENEVLYRFGCNEKNSDGLMRIDLKNIDKSEIINMPSDESVYRNYANKALAKMCRIVLAGEIPDKSQYVS